MSEKPDNEFEKHAANSSSTSFLREFWDFLCHNKKWWLLPLLLTLLLMGLLVLLTSSAAAPFIYTLF